MIEEFDRLLRNLPEDLRQIVVWKVDGFTNAKIAEDDRTHGPLRRAQDAAHPQAAGTGLGRLQAGDGLDRDRLKTSIKARYQPKNAHPVPRGGGRFGGDAGSRVQ